MFELDLVKPIILQQHEAILNRLSENLVIRSEIEEKRIILSSGYRGEKTLKYYLSLLPPKQYHIFQGLRLPIGDTFFQMDAVLFSTKLGFIIEGKNFSGDILIEKHQLTQTFNETVKIYSNPLDQVNRHKILLNNFFDKHQIPLTPIENLVSFTNQSASLQITQGYNEAQKRICKADNLLMKIIEHSKGYKQDCIDQKTISRMKKLLLNKHTPLRIDIIQTYGINKNNIITGVRCPICLFTPMDYKGRHWECPSCKILSKDAHLKDIKEYFLIFGPTITNLELREFLHLPSTRAATYLFSFLHFPYIGTTKGRIYHQPKDFL
ncbi:nuclease-related domain-containing protein [Bacillus sp. 1P10SD]|uniref:nuclease-related domain-containing protein n=1 Tax=Bacillus sp. 1P10SD TaxID=3132265 RepID=UPI0039A7433E